MNMMVSHDGLEAETVVPQGTTITLQMYPKAEVDALIAEKDEEIHRLRRALYKACANWATSKSLLSYSQAVKFESYLPTKGAKLRRRSSLWHHCYEHCEAMAEEYK